MVTRTRLEVKMVHKKTEYRLQFQLLAKDLRKQIWQDNIQFRESHRSLNQAHHYWSYQLNDEKCDCENGEENEDEAALPPHKLKHKILLAQYGGAKSNTGVQDVPKPHALSSPNQAQSDTQQQVQVPGALSNALLGTDIAPQIPGHESTEQRLKNEHSNEIENLSQSLNTVSKPVEAHTIKEQQQRVVPSQRTITIEDPRAHHRINNKAEQRGISTTLRHSETSIQPSLSRKFGLTRTTRKAYFEQKKSPFAFFGWNESDRNIGQKKTYNVYAPESEVHSPALLALKRRRTEIERYLAEEAQRRRQQSTTALEVGVSLYTECSNLRSCRHF